MTALDVPACRHSVLHPLRSSTRAMRSLIFTACSANRYYSASSPLVASTPSPTSAAMQSLPCRWTPRTRHPTLHDCTTHARQRHAENACRRLASDPASSHAHDQRLSLLPHLHAQVRVALGRRLRGRLCMAGGRVHIGSHLDQRGRHGLPSRACSSRPPRDPLVDVPPSAALAAATLPARGDGGPRVANRMRRRSRGLRGPTAARPLQHRVVPTAVPRDVRWVPALAASHPARRSVSSHCRSHDRRHRC